MTPPDSIKQCCARAYDGDIARILLGDSFHPGGLPLTERLGLLLGLSPASSVLDVASGTGATAIFLAQRFGCRVTGIDYSAANVETAAAAARTKGLDAQVRFQQGDAERLPAPGAAFDAILCECAFCTFPDKEAAAREFARVLRPGGGAGLSDLTLGAPLPDDLRGLLAWVACIADAQPLDAYVSLLNQAGFDVRTEVHDDALVEMVDQVRLRLLGAEIAVGLRKLLLPGVDFTAAKTMARAALEAIHRGELGYALVWGKLRA